MKPYLFLLIFSTIGIHAQKHEFQFHYRFGFPTDNLKPVSMSTPSGYINEYQYHQARTLYDQGTILSYKYKIWKKYKIFLNAGFELSESKHYVPIIDPLERQIDNIIIKYDRYAFHFGINKQFEFYDSRLILDLGFQFVDRYPVRKEEVYQSDYKTTTQNWIRSKYELNAYYGKYYNNDGTIGNNRYIYLNSDINATLKFNLKNSFCFNLGFSYTRNNFFFYDYTYSIEYYYNGSTTPSETFHFLGMFGNGDPKFPVRDHFFYINTGVSYKFDWKRRKTPNLN